MPLCKPTPGPLWKGLFWKEIETSPFLILQEHKPGPRLKDRFRITLAHNGYVIAHAPTLEEIKNLWKMCLRFAELGKAGTRLVTTFETLWLEFEQSKQEQARNKILLQRERTKSLHDLERWASTNTPQIQKTVFQYQDSLKSLPYDENSDSPTESVSSFDSMHPDKKQPASDPREISSHDHQIIRQLLAISTKDSVSKSHDNVQLFGNAIVVRAIRDHFHQDWKKLNFQKNDLLLAFPEAKFEPDDPSLMYGISLANMGIFDRRAVVKINFDSIKFGADLKPTSEELLRLEFLAESRPYKGWLEKRGFWGLAKDWKRRWFVLDVSQGKLYYYNTQEDELTQNFRGFILLSEVTTVHESFFPGSISSKGKWPFEIHTPQREWILRANRHQEMTMWIQQLNSVAKFYDREKLLRSLNRNESYKMLGDIRLQITTTTPGAKKPRIKPKIENREVAKIRKKASHITEKIPKENPQNWDPHDFSEFGAPDGEEITNKSTILSDLDRYLGYKSPPDVEYIYVEPYLNYASDRVFLTANPYGHSVVRYTLPDTGEQLLMNIVGLADHELVNFLPPEEFFFSTNFDTKIGNEQGGIYNRNFASIRIQRVPPEKILAMHQYFLDLHSRSHKNWADYNILLGPLLNRASSVSYGNCAHWSSQGLRQAGLMKNTSMFPKAIWVDMLEELKLYCQQDRICSNVNVVYYKRILHAKRFYGEDADWVGWGRPSDYFKTKYQNLEQISDAIIFVPPGSKTAEIRSGSHSRLAKVHARQLNLKREGRFRLEFKLSVNLDPHVLFNESFYVRINVETLQRLPKTTELQPEKQIPYKFVVGGIPLFSNCWLVSTDNRLFKTSSQNNSISDLLWFQVPLPDTQSTRICLEPEITRIAAGEDGTCWIVYANHIFYRDANQSGNWFEISSPSELAVAHLAVYTSKSGVWVLDSDGKLFSYHCETQNWISHDLAPRLDFISVGADQELWGLTKNCEVFRRIKGNLSQEERWIQLHGALLKSIAVVSHEEVWGLDQEGVVYIWSFNNNSAADGIDSWMLDSSPKLSWHALGNALPVSKISVNTQKIAWALCEHDPGCIYKLSTHRLLIISTISARKIWDDSKTGCHPFNAGFWHPTGPKGFYPLGDICERSHLENPSTGAILVSEVGHTNPDEVAILAAPVGFERLWSYHGSGSDFGDCTLWRPIPPTTDYVALGHIATMDDNRPSTESVRCVHKDFVQQSKPLRLERSYKYLWSSHGSLLSKASSPVSVWLVAPRLDAYYCNTFICSPNEQEPPTTATYCLKMIKQEE